MKESWWLPASKPVYERNIYLFLSTVRFSTFALAAALTFTIPKLPPTDWSAILIVGLVGLYTILKILFHFPLWQRQFLAYTILGIDLVVCLTVILLTRGTDSPFLLYSIVPTMTAALLFGQMVALIIASLTFLNLIIAHTGLAYLNPSFGFLLQGGYLGQVLLYGVACFALATIAYQTNLNIYRRIQNETIGEERKRLRREIHDGIAQVLSYLSTKIALVSQSLPASDKKLLSELDEIHQVMSESYQDLRQAIDSLSAESKELSLIASLSSYTEQIGKRANCQTEFTAPRKLPILSPGLQLELLRIAQEALNNVRKHASATQIWVSLKTPPQSLELVIKDNGRGFPPSEPKGAGCSIMQERAKSINGILTITSSPGQGTEVKIKVARR